MQSTKPLEYVSDSQVVQNLRAELIAGLKPMLRLVDAIEDSQIRLSLQASCLDLITGFEDLISGMQGGQDI